MYRHDVSKGVVGIPAVEVDRINMRMVEPFQPIVSGKLKALLNMPFEFPFGVTHLKQKIRILACGDPVCQSPKIIGDVFTDWDAATSEEVEGILGIKQYLIRGRMNSIGSDRVVLNVKDLEMYKSFVSKMLNDDFVDVKLVGISDSKVVTDAGMVEISGIPFDSVVRLEGLGGLKGEDILKVMNNLDLQSVKNNGTSLNLNMPDTWLKKIGRKNQVGVEIMGNLNYTILFNPSSVSGISGEEIPIGNIYMSSLNLGDSAECSKILRNKITSEIVSTDDLYCKIYSSGVYNVPDTEKPLMECNNPTDCVTRKFLSNWMAGVKETEVSLRLDAGPPDMENVISQGFVINGIKLPPYRTPINYDLRRPPFRLLKRIIVNPSWKLPKPDLQTWLEFYNPNKVPVRIYYMEVKSYYDNTYIGSLNINMTTYDPFVLARKNGTYEPPNPDYHAPDSCEVSRDCQIGPFELTPEGGSGPRCFNNYRQHTVISQRLQIEYDLNIATIKLFLKLQTARKAKLSFTAKVLMGLGVNEYKKIRRDKKPKVTNEHDPYWDPDDPKDNVLISWLDYYQEDADIELLPGGLKYPAPDSPYDPEDCDNNQ
jgi:hypothetical protein